MHRKIMLGGRCAVLVLGITLAIPHILTAQTTTTGAIDGTVEDQSGSAVGGAKVVVLNEGTNAELTVAADRAGFSSPGSFSPARIRSLSATAGSATTKQPR
jgi:hypothetical protein